MPLGSPAQPFALTPVSTPLSPPVAAAAHAAKTPSNPKPLSPREQLRKRKPPNHRVGRSEQNEIDYPQNGPEPSHGSVTSRRWSRAWVGAMECKSSADPN